MLHTLATGSKGNAYELFDGRTRVLLECGFAKAALRKLCKRALTDYVGCLVTHEHMDHAKSAAYLAGLGLPVYMTDGTAYALGIEEHREIKAQVQFGLGTYQIVPFRTIHDAAEPCGFLIYSDATREKLLFATDTLYLPYRFAGLTEIAIECNYSADMLAASSLSEQIKQRIARTHMSLDHLLDVMAAADLSRVRRIHLLHLSDNHSNARDLVQTVHAATGVMTTIG